MHRSPSVASLLALAVAASGCSLVVDPDASVQPECTTRLGPVGEENVVLLGAILPIQGNASSIGVPMMQAIELAVSELNDTGGLGDQRRLGVIVCDSSGRRAQGLEVADYLVNDLSVPLIIGPAFSGIFIDVTTQVTVPAGVMTLSPSATSPVIAGLPDEGLAWRTAASDIFQGVAIADLVEVRGFSRVIALGKADAYGRGLLTQVNENVGTRLGEGYISTEYPDPGTVENPNYADPITNSLSTVPDPDVVLLLGTNEVAQLLELFESDFEMSGTSTAARPSYIFADGGAVDETIAQLEMAEGTLTPRVEGTRPDHQPEPLFGRFALAFRQRFGEDPGIYTSNSYDATYLAAYAAMTGVDLSGRQFAAAMARLADTSAMKIDAGPSDLGTARQVLTTGGSVDYDGASGPLDFDLATGEAPANVSLWQPRRNTRGEWTFSTAGSYIVGSDGRGMWTIRE